MKRYHVIAVAAILVIAVGWYFVFLKPASSKRTQLQIELQERNYQLTDFRRTLAEFPDYFKAQKELLREKNRIIAQLYARDDLRRLFDEINNKCNTHNVTLMEIAPSVEELIMLNRQLPEDGQPFPLNITVKVKGHMPAAGKFIREIENEEYYQGTNYCTIRNTEKNMPKSHVTFSFRAILGTIKES